jgi:uncharacterized protein YjiS (DUF1127 family)
MTYFRPAPSQFDDINVFPRYKRHTSPPVKLPFAGAVFAAARGLGLPLLSYGRRVAETRRARRHLLELDDRLLQDVGLTRVDVRFGDFETLGRHRRTVGFR